MVVDDGHEDDGDAFDAWSVRARRTATLQPLHRVGSVVRTDEAHAACVQLSAGGVETVFSLIDVPAQGNCLYHSAWQSAQQIGIHRPFDCRATDHVFLLRVATARRAVNLLRTEIIIRGDITDILAAGELIAKPNQWETLSGEVPIMAMSHRLRRTIVVLSADGVSCVAPYDFEAIHGVEDIEDPVVVYHCKWGELLGSVDIGSRNHYTATKFDAVNIDKVKQYVARHRRRNNRVDLSLSAGQHDVVEADGVLEHTKRQKTGRDRMFVHRGLSQLSAKQSGSDGRKKTMSKQREDAVRERGSSHGKQGNARTSSSSRDSSSDQQTNTREEEVLRSLDIRALTLTHVTPEEMRVLSDRQNFSKSPRLALLYYHCCSNDPNAFVHNNEELLGPAPNPTVERLAKSLPCQVSQEELARCQQLASERDSSATQIAACASCCEILIRKSVCEVPFDRLPTSFRYTEAEKSDLKQYPPWIIEKHLQVLEAAGEHYHLNPDLVPDRSVVTLCSRCLKDPRKSRFSIASGHDYGRRANLPTLGDVERNCVAPARCFGLELALNGRHSTGHAICFPSDGPMSCSGVLPCTESSCLPRVTFIGPAEQWRAQKKKYRKLYSISCDYVYEWLRVLRHCHTTFIEKSIVVEASPGRRKQLKEMVEYVERNVVCVEDPTSLSYQDGMHSERYGVDVEDTDDDGVVVSRAAVLRATEGTGPAAQSVVDAMLNMISSNEADDQQVVIPIQRGSEPFVEWTSNGKLIACVFPELFMRGGDRLPQGSWSSDFASHLMNYYDGRFEQSTSLVSMLFNQLQRHSAVQRAAKVGVSHSDVLKKFGTLVNSQSFREELTRAKENPKTEGARRLNASLLRVLSLIGGSVPFSPFERAATKPKISAMRYRYGVPQHWVTLAAPEHDDLLVHRVANLRENERWNDPNCIFGSRACKFSDLPPTMQGSAKARLAVTSTYPALSAESFERRFRTMILDVMQSTISSDMRVSRHYGERKSGLYGGVAGHCSIVEAQRDGRLHSHSLIYGSSYTPQLLTRIACHPELRERAKKWLDSVSCASFAGVTHEWLKSAQDSDKRLPRAYEIDLPEARGDCKGFWCAAERRAATTNIHKHSFTCYKGMRGKYMCRLARPAGVHVGPTQPLILSRQKVGNLSKGVRPVVHGVPLDSESSAVIDREYNIDAGEVFPKRLRGPLAWELHRPLQDVSVVETNLALAALTASHTNSSIISGEDSGDSVEQYQQSYMTKDQASLNGAVPMLLSAAAYVSAHPSQADDRDTDIRKGKYLATRAVNGFSGGHEWPHTLMAFALKGNRSLVTSDSFWYIFPWALVKRMREQKEKDKCKPPVSPKDKDEREEIVVEDYLDEIIAMANNDVDGCSSGNVRERGGGARSFRVRDKVVFLTQVESYLHRGELFAAYSPLEYECIVDVLPMKPIEASVKTGVGRPARKGFAFASTHPLYGEYAGYIRMKMHTAVFGGRPPPRWKEDVGDKASSRDERSICAEYLVCTFSAWKNGKPEFSCCEQGLLKLLKEWDHSEAPLVLRQRYRYVRNVLQPSRRSSSFESILTDWRNRGVDLWKDKNVVRSQTAAGEESDCDDNERNGKLSKSFDVTSLATQIARADECKRSMSRSLREVLWSAFGSETITVSDGNNHLRRLTGHGVSSKMYGGHLQMLAARLRVARIEDVSPHPRSGWNRVEDASLASTSIDTTGLSSDQEAVVRHILSAVDSNGRPKQTLTMLHGAGGTGKSYAIRRVCREIEQRGYKVVSTCPTGAGACQLDRGQTFHSAFKCLRKKELSAHSLEVLRSTFDDRVVLIVVDEVSMFGADLLYLLDRRLRTIYGSDLPFAGKAILLVGDFSQLRVVSGMPLCKLMYSKSLTADQSVSKNLFASFKVMFLTHQQRARDCPMQQSVLSAMRVLPGNYPEATNWKFVSNKDFYPVSADVGRVLTNALSRFDVTRDPEWLFNSVILVTGNEDRAVMNASMAKILSERLGLLLFRWRKRLCDDVEAELGLHAELLYNEDERPTLFAYFFKGARGQILDNANGNVELGIANGTLCTYHSLEWDDNAKTSAVIELIETSVRRGQQIVDLPFPPDYVNVTLLQRDGSPVPATSWNTRDYLENAENNVVVPIGVVASKSDGYFVKIAGRKDLKLGYEQHAVDMAMALTIWKAQGATFARVVLLLEGSSSSPAWQFEHLYVALSRVRSIHHIRCLPLSLLYNPREMFKLRPDIHTVRWRMDLNKNGYWEDGSVTRAG